jgi:hypothetical protein
MPACKRHELARGLWTVSGPGRIVQKLQIGHLFETRGGKCDYITLRNRVLTLGRSWSARPLDARRRPRVLRESAALCPGRGCGWVRLVDMVGKCRSKSAIEDGRQCLAYPAHFTDLRGED